MTDGLPVFLRIAHAVRDRILSGELAAGHEVPSERTLARDWAVARPTAARALQVLRSEGWIESRRGAGSFVRASADGRSVSAEDGTQRLVRAREVRVTGRLAAELGVPPGTLAVRRNRIVRRDAATMEISTSWYVASAGKPIGRVAGRLLRPEHLPGGELAYLEAATGRVGVRATEEFAARLATAAEARVLRVTLPAAVLAIRRRVLDAAGLVLELTETTLPETVPAVARDMPLLR